MRVTVTLHATLRQYAPPDAERGRTELELPAGATPATAAAALGIPEGHAGLVAVDGEKCDLDVPLAEGQEVALFPPMAGGLDAP